RNSTVIRARSFELSLVPSVTACETYTRLDDSLLNFNSNLPLVILNTSGQYIYRGRKVPISARFIAAGGRSSPLGSADFDGRCDIHARGHSSMHFPKHSYTMHLRDDTWSKARASLFGMPKESDWILYAPFTDKTLMRDV